MNYHVMLTLSILSASLTQKLPGKHSHLSGCWPLSHMYGNYQSPYFQSNQWWCVYSSERGERTLRWQRSLLVTVPKSTLGRHFKCATEIKQYCDHETLTSVVLISSRLSTAFIGSTFCWRMKSAMAVTDLWPLYSRFIIIPFLNSFSVGYLLIL